MRTLAKIETIAGIAACLFLCACGTLQSRGVLVADIGMTFDEVRQKSTFPVKDGSAMYGGTQLAHETAVFDYRIGDSGMQFPQSRYYWLRSRKEDPRRIAEINIGITPQKMPKPDLLAFQDRVREQLVKDGWVPGHYIADSEKTITLWAGKRTTGEGRYWLRRNTVLILETNRVDEEVKDEAPGSGAFILYIDMRPKGDDKDLVFEASAWPPPAR